MKKPITPIGPQTKRETKKTARVAKKADSKVLTPMTAQASKEKIKTNRKKAAVAVGATIGTIGAGLYSMYLDKTKPERMDRKRDKAKGK
jgi:hypothetical protein